MGYPGDLSLVLAEEAEPVHSVQHLAGFEIDAGELGTVAALLCAAQHSKRSFDGYVLVMALLLAFLDSKCSVVAYAGTVAHPPSRCARVEGPGRRGGRPTPTARRYRAADRHLNFCDARPTSGSCGRLAAWRHGEDLDSVLSFLEHQF